MDKYKGHTPGPWKYTKKDTYDGFIETADGVWGICGMKAGVECAYVNEYPGDMSEKTYNANARLIADCPIMLAYIKKKAAEGDEDAAKILKG